MRAPFVLRHSWAPAVLLALSAGQTHAQQFRTVSSSRRPAGEQDMKVDVEFAAGRFTLGPDATGSLYRSMLTYEDGRYNPIMRFDPASRTLKVGIDELHLSGRGRRGRSDRRDLDKQHLELSLSPNVPTSLQLTFGAGDANVDLGGLTLTSAELKMGASETRVRYSTPNKGLCQELQLHIGAIDFRADQLGNSRCSQFALAGGAGSIVLDFSGDWGPVTQARADVAVGVGELTLRLPRSLGVEIEVTKFLTSFDSNGFIKRGGAYFSEGFDAAKTKIKFEINAALGNIQVEWI